MPRPLGTADDAAAALCPPLVRIRCCMASRNDLRCTMLAVVWATHSANRQRYAKAHNPPTTSSRLKASQHRPAPCRGADGEGPRRIPCRVRCVPAPASTARRRNSWHAANNSSHTRDARARRRRMGSCLASCPQPCVPMHRATTLRTRTRCVKRAIAKRASSPRGSRQSHIAPLAIEPPCRASLCELPRPPRPRATAASTPSKAPPRPPAPPSATSPPPCSSGRGSGRRDTESPH